VEIIALSGYARSGKDTIADHLVEKYGFIKLSFATPMREALYRLNPEIRDMTGLVYTFKQAVNLFGWDDMKTYFPPYRGLMQRMGTEVGREMFGEDFWVDQALKQLEGNSKIVFADCRYQNEASAVRNAGGDIWRVHKPGVEAANDHTSEHDLDDYTFDSYVLNVSTIEELKRLVDDKYATIRKS
jgi:hypothetical protein